MRKTLIKCSTPEEYRLVLRRAVDEGAARVVDRRGCETAARHVHELMGLEGPYVLCFDEPTVPVAELLGVPVAPAKTGLQGDRQARKNAPVFRGMLAYFPDAVAGAAELSRIGNEQHNKGEPMHWAYEKSNDHGDCILRHQADYEEIDDDGVPHCMKVLWRAAAQAQVWCEKRDPELHAKRQAQRDRQARGER